jgi:hypothetical protein
MQLKEYIVNNIIYRLYLCKIDKFSYIIRTFTLHEHPPDLRIEALEIPLMGGEGGGHCRMNCSRTVMFSYIVRFKSDLSQ